MSSNFHISHLDYLIPPVNALWLLSNGLNVGLWESLESLCLVSVVSADELLAGKVGKLVDTEGKSVEAKSMLGVVLLDQLQVADEHVLPVVVLQSEEFWNILKYSDLFVLLLRHAYYKIKFLNVYKAKRNQSDFQTHLRS